MKFKTIAESYNFYKTQTIEQIEKRASEINHLIETDANADVEALNIEAEGMNQAMRELRSQGGSAPEFRGFNFLGSSQIGGHAEEVEDFASTKEYRSAFFKTLLGKKLSQAEQRAFDAVVETRSDAYSNISDTVAVIPTQTMNEIVVKARKIGGIMSVARMFAVPAKMSLPVATPGGKASWNPTEGAPVDSEKANVAYVAFGSHEMIKVLSISASVKKMSVSAFESYLTDELTNCIMEGLADCAVNGSVSGGKNVYGAGVNDGISIVWTPGENAIEYAENVSYNDIVNTIALLKRGYSANARFAMNNKTLYKQIYGLVDSSKKPIFVQDAQNDTVGKILGFEVVVDDNLADGDILFGDFKYLGVNLVDGIAIDVSTQSSFKAGRVDYRAMAIADTQVIVPEAFVKCYKTIG